MGRGELTKDDVMQLQLSEWAAAQNLACPEHPGPPKADSTTMRMGVYCGAEGTAGPWQAVAPPDVAAAVEVHARLYVSMAGGPSGPTSHRPAGISDFGKVCIWVIAALVIFFVAFYVMAEIKTPDSTIDIIGGKDIPDGGEGQ